MKNLLNSVKAFPLFWTFVIFMLFLFPNCLLLPAESDRYAIVTSFGVDKSGDEIEVSVLLNVPTPTVSYTETFNLTSAKAESISKAISKIELQLGKELGLQHTSIFALGKDFASDDFVSKINIMLRAEKIGNNALVVMTDGKAKDLLSTSVSVDSKTGIKLSEIIKYNKDHSLSINSNLEQVFKGYLSPANSYFMPIVNVTQLKSDSITSSNVSGGQSGSSGEQGDPSSQSGGSSSGGSSGEKEKTISNTGELALIKNGSYVSTLSLENVKALNWINKNMDYGEITIKDYSDGDLKNVDISFDIKHKLQNVKVNYVNGFPTITYSIYLNLVSSEIVYENRQLEAFSILNSHETPQLKKRINEEINIAVSKAVNELRKVNVDAIEAYDKLLRKDEKLFQQFIDKVGIENYMKFVEIVPEVHIVVKN